MKKQSAQFNIELYRGFAPILIILVVLALGALGFVSYKYNLNKISGPLTTLSTPNTSQLSNSDMENWKTYNFSPTISLKLPKNVSDPKYVNTGHYAVETTLPGNTTLQIWGADGASPTGGKDDYDLEHHLLTTSGSEKYIETGTQIDGKDALEFTTTAPTSFILGGETSLRTRGLLVKMDDGRPLFIIHYQGQTLQKDGDFAADEETFDQILSTFKFLDKTDATKICLNNDLKLTLNIPENWNCNSSEDTGAGWLKITSDIFEINISSLGRGPYCFINGDEACNISAFYSNSLMGLSMYKLNNSRKEVFGSINNDSGTWLSVKWQNMETNDLNSSQKSELIKVLDSMSKIK